MFKMYLNRVDLAALIQKLGETGTYATYFDLKEKLELLDVMIEFTGNTSIKTEVEISGSEIYKIR